MNRNYTRKEKDMSSIKPESNETEKLKALRSAKYAEASKLTCRIAELTDEVKDKVDRLSGLKGELGVLGHEIIELDKRIDSLDKQPAEDASTSRQPDAELVRRVQAFLKSGGLNVSQFLADCMKDGYQPEDVVRLFVKKAREAEGCSQWQRGRCPGRVKCTNSDDSHDIRDRLTRQYVDDFMSAMVDIFMSNMDAILDSMMKGCDKPDSALDRLF